MKGIAVVLAVAVSGCTVAFGALGGASASSSNREARSKGQPETASVGARIVVGALVGLAVDALILNASLDGCCPDLSGLNSN